MIRQGGFRRKSKAASEIPSSSLADMAFLLLIFFMVTTTFRKEEPRAVVMPEAEAAERLEAASRDVLHVYVERDGAVFINDQQFEPEQVAPVVAPIREEVGERLAVVIRADRGVPYAYIERVKRSLQQAGAVRVTFYTELQDRLAR